MKETPNLLHSSLLYPTLWTCLEVIDFSGDKILATWKQIWYLSTHDKDISCFKTLVSTVELTNNVSYLFSVSKLPGSIFVSCK